LPECHRQFRIGEVAHAENDVSRATAAHERILKIIVEETAPSFVR
jgi:hypothetical protein